MENTLNIQITLNDEQLKNLIVGNINDLPKDKLQEVLLQAVKEVLTSKEGQKLFMTQGTYYDSANKPSTFLSNLVQKADITDSISPIVNEAMKDFERNYQEIMTNCIKSTISDMFMNQFDRSRFVQMWDMVTHRGD